MLKKIIHNIKYEPQKRMNAILVLVAVIAVVYAMMLFLLVAGLTSKNISSHKDEQDKYCKQLSYALDSLLENEATDEELINYIAGSVDVAGDIWPFLIRDEQVIYAKDKSTTQNLRTLEDKTLFLNNLKEQNQLLSTYVLPKHTNYTVGILADKNKYNVSGGISVYRAFFVIMVVSLLVIGVAAVVYVTGFWTKSDKKLLGIQEKLRVRNEEFEIYKNKNEEYYSTNSLMPESHGRSNRYKQYAFKFYINARHAIYIDGKLGAMHPHTWEIHLNVIKVSNDFVQFNEVEKAIEALIAPFQDKEINSIEPFNVINPTLENCCNYFRDEIAKILKDKGWLMLMIEMSETPSRSYVVNMIADDT